MMLMGHVQDMIQRLAANRREAKPRGKKEKMLDLLASERDVHPTTRPATDPAVVERAIADIREKARRKRRRQRIIATVLLLAGTAVTVYLVMQMLNLTEAFPWGEFEIDEAGRMRRTL